jgi:hypothetical protein
MADDGTRSSSAKPIIIAALILLGGYIAYDQWRQHDQHSGECATLKRQFTGNMNSMIGPVNSAIDESKREGNQIPMLSVADRVQENQRVMNRLNVECPDWQAGKYD